MLTESCSPCGRAACTASRSLAAAWSSYYTVASPANDLRHGRLVQDPGKPAEPVESVELIRTTVRHFLADFNRRLARLADPRDENRWFYSVPHLTWLGLSMFLGGMESRYHLENCSDTPEFHKNLLALCGTQEDDLAHPDTLDYLLRLMQPDEFIGFQADCMRRLIRSKALDRFRLGNEFLVAVDGTGYRSFPRQHCPRCLHQKRPDGSSIWFHHVLEAKLITSAGMVFSLGSMLIENPAGKYEKQECELKTFYRFVPMLKALYPRLPICLLLDSLYAGEPTLDLCEKHRLGFFIVFTEGKIPTLWNRAQQWIAKHPEAKVTFYPKAATKQRLRWAPALKYRDSTLHFIDCEEKSKRNGRSTHWAWLTDARPNARNVHKLVNGGARLRWKIENEGFNVQKNGGLALVHGYGGRGNALFGYYVLAQIAHMILQLIAHSDLLRKVQTGTQNITSSVMRYYRTLRNLTERLRESLRRDRLSEQTAARFAPQIQIRFDTS